MTLKRKFPTFKETRSPPPLIRLQSWLLSDRKVSEHYFGRPPFLLVFPLVFPFFQPWTKALAFLNEVVEGKRLLSSSSNPPFFRHQLPPFFALVPMISIRLRSPDLNAPISFSISHRRDVIGGHRDNNSLRLERGTPPLSFLEILWPLFPSYGNCHTD